MSAEHQPKGDPILVRVEKDHPLANKGEIQVWNKVGDIHRETPLGPYVQDALSHQTIQIPGADGQKFHTEHFAKSLKMSEAREQGQEDLARELARLPLRGDRVIVKVGEEYLEGEIDSYYTVEGVKYAAFKDLEGNLHGAFIDTLNAEAQADLLKAKETHDAEEKGEVALDAAGIEEPEISPWSFEASKARRESNMPGRENPHMFDEIEDPISPVEFEQVPGEVLRGRKVGWFNENGKNFSIIEPTPESRVLAQTTEAQMIVPDEVLRPARIFTETTPVDETTTERKPAAETTESGPGMSDKEYLEKLIEGLAPDDEHHLQMYAMAEADKIVAQKAGDNDGSRDAQESMGWHLQRMSESAKDIKARYASRYRSMNNL